MIRKQALFMALMLTLPGIAGALGLSTIELNSALNEPLDARIKLLGTTPDQLDFLRVSLGSSEDFSRAGIPRPFFLVSLKFKVVEPENAEPYISVTSQDSVKEPFLNFLIRAEWQTGRILREYTVLLDPPLYNPYRSLSSTEPAAGSQPVTDTGDAEKTAVGGTDVALSHEVHYNSSAPTAPRTRSTASSYGTGPNQTLVGEAETLWSIASRMRPNNSVSVQQMMLALFNHNPDAFINNNMNLLKRGAVLEMPDLEQANDTSTSEAISELNRHQEMWEEYRQKVSSEPGMQPMGTSSSAGTGAMDSPEGGMEVTDGRLELVSQTEAAEADSGLTGTGGSGESGQYAAGEALDLVNEQLEAMRMENSDLRSRLSSEQELVNLLQRKVEIADDQLAALQAAAAAAGVDVDSILAGDATETMAEGGEQMPGVDTDMAAGTEMVQESAAEGMQAGEPDTASGQERLPADSAASTETEQSATEQTAPVEEQVSIDLDEKSAAGAQPAEAEEEVSVEVERPVQEPGLLDQARDILSLVIPADIIDSLPGGVITVLAVVLLIPLLLIALVLKRRGGGDEIEETPMPLVAADTDSEAVTEFADSETEDITDVNEAATADATVEPDFDDETPTEFNVQAAEELDQTVTAEPTPVAAAAEPEEDPLEEVNVYLAYEQFDQAEALVKKVIADHPDNLDYKLRLLEVYYSSSNKAAYEEVAREVHEATGGEGEAWGNTVAMWEAMSPDRELFAEGGAGEAETTAGGKEFLDLTSDAESETDSGVIDLGEETVSMAPGGVVEPEEEDEGLDFDLAGSGDDEEEDILDLTAVENVDEAGEEDVLDLTALDEGPTEGTQDGVLDLTAAEDDTDDDDVLDLTSVDLEEEDEDEVLDLTAGDDEQEEVLELSTDDEDEDVIDMPEETDLLDLTGTSDHLEANSDTDLLDVTSSGSISDLDTDSLGMAGESDDLLDVTNVSSVEQMEDSDMMDVSDKSAEPEPEMAADDHVLEFDIGASDEDAADEDDATLVMASEDQELADDMSLELDDGSEDIDATAAPDEEGMLDLTADAGDDELLDLSLGGDEQGADDDEALDLTASSDDDELLDLSLGGDEQGADDEEVLDLTASSEDDELLDLSLAGDEDVADDDGMLDLTSEADDDLALDLSLGADDEIAVDDDLQDLSLDAGDEDDMDSAGDDLLDLSLDDGASDLELDDGTDDSSDEAGLDLSLEFEEEDDSTNDIFLDTHGNDTVEMPAVNVESMSVADVDSSLDELAESLDAIEAEVGESLSEARQSDDTDLDFSLDLDEDEALSTMQLDTTAADDEGDVVDKTVVMPRSPEVEQQSEAEETDNKLNLARAYIELGDKDGARSILEEVVVEGDGEQKSEAEDLLSQLD